MGQKASIKDKRNAKTHLIEAFRWSRDADADWVAILASALGVLATGVLLIAPPPDWVLVACMAVLAGLRPLLRVRNFLAYSAVMTPLIILVLDAGRTPELGILIDRLVATLIGAALVIAVNLLFGKLLGKPA